MTQFFFLLHVNYCIDFRKLHEIGALFSLNRDKFLWAKTKLDEMVKVNGGVGMAALCQRDQGRMYGPGVVCLREESVVLHEKSPPSSKGGKSIRQGKSGT